MSRSVLVAKKYDVSFDYVNIPSSDADACLNAMYDYDVDVIMHSDAWDFDMFVLDGTEFQLDKAIVERFIKDNAGSNESKTAQLLLDNADPANQYIVVYIG
jgi:hypothetical protein